MSVLRLSHVSFAYPGFDAVVDDVDLAVDAGTVHCLLGRSGCGKTTLLKIGAGLLVPTAGSVRWQGSPEADRRAVGFVFQAPTLLEWLSARDNVLLPVTLQRRATTEDERRADELLDQLGLVGLAERHPAQLSGGQQSRVALARALLLQPDLLLLDEPFAALDALTREELQRDLLRFVRERRTAVVFVTHDIHEAVYLGSDVSVMEHGRLVHTAAIDRATAGVRDTPGFAAACAGLREQLAGEGVAA